MCAELGSVFAACGVVIHSNTKLPNREWPIVSFASLNAVPWYLRVQCTQWLKKSENHGLVVLHHDLKNAVILG
jgi:hypothetical protein